MTLAQDFRGSEESALAVAVGTRILLVSSDELRLRRLAGSARGAGGSVTAVCCGEEARALLRIGYRPGLLMMDDALPEADRSGLADMVLGSAAPGAVAIVTLVG